MVFLFVIARTQIEMGYQIILIQIVIMMAALMLSKEMEVSILLILKTICSQAESIWMDFLIL